MKIVGLGGGDIGLGIASSLLICLLQAIWIEISLTSCFVLVASRFNGVILHVGATKVFLWTPKIDVVTSFSVSGC